MTTSFDAAANRPFQLETPRGLLPERVKSVEAPIYPGVDSPVGLDGAGDDQSPSFASKFIAASLNTLPVNTLGVSAEDVSAHVDLAKRDKAIVKESIVETYNSWRAQEGLKSKVTSPVIGSLSWANLMFGEAVALGAQGLAQAGDASNWKSWMVGIGAALVVETGFTLPVARKFKEKQPKEVVAEGAAVGFWMGGAMGVENKKLPIRQAPAAIGAYMIFGTALAGLAEYNNSAEQFVNHKEVIIPALVTWGLIKKVNELNGYKSPSDVVADRMVDGTVKAVNRLQRPKPAEASGTPERLARLRQPKTSPRRGSLRELSGRRGRRSTERPQARVVNSSLRRRNSGA